MAGVHSFHIRMLLLALNLKMVLTINENNYENKTLDNSFVCNIISDDTDHRSNDNQYNN